MLPEKQTNANIGVGTWSSRRAERARASEKRTNANIGVATGFLLQLAGMFLARIGGTVAIQCEFGYVCEECHPLVGGVLILISIPLFIWGCMNYAEGKGHSKWVGLVGLAGIVGLIVLVMLPERDLQGSVARLQWLKVVGLISLVAGLGLEVLARWLDRLSRIDPAHCDVDRLRTWSGWCTFLGACLAFGSLFLLLRQEPPLMELDG